MKPVKTLFLAWQDPVIRRWYPIGRLSSSNGLYTFAYTKGAEQAQGEAGFRPLVSFPELLTVYVSEQLFPLFTNRLLPTNRPEYNDYLRWLGLPASEHDPIAILARSGGERVTDTLEVFPSPERNERSEYEVHFLPHGLRHMPEASVERVLHLKPGEPLLAMWDFQNPKDPDALAIRTERDAYLVGYCPRYLRGDILKLMQSHAPQIVVEQVNPPPAPVQFRVLCKAVMVWPKGFEPFSDPEFQPIVPDAEARSSRISLPLGQYR